MGRVLVALWMIAALDLRADERQEVEHVARRFVALSHEGAFGDLDALMTTNAAGHEAYERSLRNALRVRCLRIDGIFVRELHVDGATAAVELEIATRRSDRRTPEEWRATTVASLRLRLARSADRWLIAAIEFPDEELADALISASAEERRMIAASTPRRITGAVARIVSRRANDVILRREAQNAAAVAELARDLARISGDLDAEAEAVAILAIAAGARDPHACEHFSREALALAEATDDADALAWAWIAMGNAYSLRNRHSGLPEAAFRKALAVAEHAENPRLLVSALHIVAGLEFVRSDYFTTRVLLERSRPLLQDPDEWAAAIWYDIQLAYIYYRQGDYERSLHHLHRGLRGAEERDAWILPYALIRMSELHIAMERFDDARNVLLRAKEISRGGHGIHAAMLRQFATLEALRGNLEEAECVAREAAESWTAGGYHYGPELNVLFPLLSKRKQYRHLLAYALETAGYVQEKLPTETVTALTAAAEAYRALGMSDRAEATIREAITLREELHERIAGGADQQARWSDSTAACYELAAEINLDRGNVAEALATLERGRGRVLYDTLRHGRREEISETHEEELARLHAALTAAAGRGDLQESARLRERYDAARSDHQTYLDGLRAREERRLAGSRPAEESSLQDLVRRLPHGVVAIEYAVRDEQLHAFAVRRDAAGKSVLTRRTTPITRTTLEQRVAELVNAITRRDFRYRSSAKALYSLLLAPLERELAGAETLLIMPDDVLWRIPFAALVDSSGRFAIERWPIVYAPSIRVYVAMAESRRGAPGTRRVLALANPTIGTGAQTELKNYYRDLSFGPLPDAEREADALCSLYARQCLILKREEATETRARSAIARTRIVHFATHGVLDDRNPMYSRLILGRGARSTDDGALEAWEIARMAIDAELVVLSACDTARGTIGGGEGVVGMAWAFFLAGARSTVATQWKVGSESAADLTIAFHQSLRARERELSLRKARALRDAQVRLSRDPRTRHPFYWAGFVILGDAS